MRSVLAKIAESLQGSVSLDIESLTEQFTVLSEDHAKVEPQVWQAVARAINRRERLVMDYRRFDGHAGSYRVEPHHLAAYADFQNARRRQAAVLEVRSQRVRDVRRGIVE